MLAHIFKYLEFPVVSCCKHERASSYPIAKQPLLLRRRTSPKSVLLKIKAQEDLAGAAASEVRAACRGDLAKARAGDVQIKVTRVICRSREHRDWQAAS